MKKVGQPSYNHDGDKFRHEGRRPERARNARFEPWLQIRGHNQWYNRPSYLGSYENDRAERETPTDLFGGEFWLRGGDDRLLSGVPWL